MGSLDYLLTQVRRLVLAFPLVVASLAAARNLNGGSVPPEYVTVPLIVVSVAAAIALDTFIARLFRSRTADR